MKNSCVAWLFGFLACLAGPVLAATVTCGDTIDKPGFYTLAASCSCPGDGPCIRVIADDVTLDLDNKTVSCTPANPSTNATTFGIFAYSVRNFALMGADPSIAVSTAKVTGCFFGLHAAYNAGVFVDRVDFSGNTYIGANTGYSTDVLLTRNTVKGISGYVGSDGRNAYAIAFIGCGTRCTLSSNIVRIAPQPNAVAPSVGEGVAVITSPDATSATLSHNWLESSDEAGQNIGIWVATGSTVVVEDNSLTGFWEAISGPGAVTARNNRLLMRNAAAHTDSIGIFALGGCASNNLIVRYALPTAAIADCGGNISY
jgi:hypothetical protein